MEDLTVDYSFSMYSDSNTCWEVQIVSLAHGIFIDFHFYRTPVSTSL